VNKYYFKRREETQNERIKTLEAKCRVLTVENNLSSENDLSTYQKEVWDNLYTLKDMISKYEKIISTLPDPKEFIIDVCKFKNNKKYRDKILKSFKELDEWISYTYKIEQLSIKKEHFKKYKLLKEQLKKLSNNQRYMSAAINPTTRKLNEGKMSLEDFRACHTNTKGEFCTYRGSTVAKNIKNNNLGYIPRLISHILGTNTANSTNPAGGVSLRLAEWYDGKVKITLYPKGKINNVLLKNIEELEKRMDPPALGKIVE